MGVPPVWVNSGEGGRGDGRAVAVTLEELESRRLYAAVAAEPPPAPAVPDPNFIAYVAFQPPRAAPVEGYERDNGKPFADSGNGLTYGWNAKTKVRARRGKLAPDPRFGAFAVIRPGRAWELAVPQPGRYKVHVAVGDAAVPRGLYRIDVEGVRAIDASASNIKQFFEADVTVPVTDGRLTISGAEGARGNKINFVNVQYRGGLDVPPPVDEPIPQPPPAPGALGGWRTLRRSPVPRAEGVGAAVNGRLFVLGGFSSVITDNHFLATPRSDAFDPATNTWSRVADMPEPFTHATGVVVGTTIWFIGGYSGNHPGPGYTHVWRYDTVANTWSRGPDLPEPRGAGAAAYVNGSIHFFGGMDATRTIDHSQHWALDLSNPAAGWVPRAPLIRPRNHLAAASVGGQIYAIGGQFDEEENQLALASVERYDPATDSWTTVASLPGPRSHIASATFAYNGKIIVVGGEIGFGQVRREVFSYDPAANRWRQIGLLPAGRSTTVSGVVDGMLVVATGNSPTATTTTWGAQIG